MGTADFASRLRARFSKRRHSAAGSFASSNQSAVETSSLNSRHWDWHRAVGQSHGQDDDQNQSDQPSRRAASQDRAATRRGSSHQGGDRAQPEDQRESEPHQHHHQQDTDDIAATQIEPPSIPIRSRTRAQSSESRDPKPVPATTPTLSSTTGAVPPATTTALTAPDTAPDTALEDQNNPLSTPGPRQSRAGLASNDKLGNDLHRSWQAPPQPQPQSETQSRPNERPSASPPNTPDLSPTSTPSRPPRLRPSNPNLDRIHEDSSAETSSSPAPHSDADAEVDAEAETRRHEFPLKHHHAPSTPSAAVATLAGTFASSPALPPTTVFPSSSSSSPRPAAPPRRQSLLPNRQSALIKTLLQSPSANDFSTEPSLLLPIDANMVTRKIWVKRPHASPTLIVINEDDLVDDVRDMILRKYANSLGRTFDSPDLNIRICPRDQQHKERQLGPEEPMGRTLDAYFPGGQSVDEALIIDIPRRPPKASPRIIGHYYEEGRPSETGEGYFPPVGNVSSPHLPVAVPVVHANSQAPHSIAIIGTGQIPPIPSPGGNRSTRSHRERPPERPRLGRTHTSSPTITANGAPNATPTHTTPHFNLRQPHHRTLSNSSEKSVIPPSAHPAAVNPPLPTPPAPESTQARVATPPPARTASPRPSVNRAKKGKKNPEHPNLPPGMLNGTIPPINVLIVEDNPINLKLLEAFVKRLKVRWETAMNGRDAVKKWRKGGFHLVLMDIQLPVMNGLDATREIRRLERVNTIGVFSSSPSSSIPEEDTDELKEHDRLENLTLFKSPVIIVALTASSLQSDRHEALAAGCNDFLTKPVNFVWLERKVMEWGCMQALIDFDGWRKWKVISKEAEEEEAKRKAALTKAKAKAKKNKQLSSGAS